MYAFGGFLCSQVRGDLRVRELAEAACRRRQACGAQEIRQRQATRQTRRVGIVRTASVNRSVVFYLAAKAVNNLSALLQRMASMKVST